MKFTEEQLSAYLDGELPDKLMVAIKKAIIEDPKIAKRLSVLDMANQSVKAAYGDIADEPIPTEILALLDENAAATKTHASDNVVPFKARLAAVSVSKWAMPIAATLAMMMGVSVGRSTLLAPDGGGVLYAQLTGTITTSSPLYEVLESEPSAVEVRFDNGADNGASIAIKPTLTFQTADGQYCREFQAQSEVSALRGVACRDETAWTILTLNQAEKYGGDGYKTASGASGAIVDQVIDAIISGDPLSSEDENTLIARGWKTSK